MAEISFFLSWFEPAEQQTAAAFPLLFSTPLHFIHTSTNAIFVNCLEKDAHNQKKCLTVIHGRWKSTAK